MTLLAALAVLEDDRATPEATLKAFQVKAAAAEIWLLEIPLTMEAYCEHE